MPDIQKMRMPGILIAVLGILMAGPLLFAQAKKPLTFEDMMRFRAIQNPVISENGHWVAFAAQPDRGDGEVRVRSVRTDKVFVVERGMRPAFSKDGRWLACAVSPSAVDMEKAAKDRPKPGLALLSLDSGKTVSVAGVESFDFSSDSAWLAYRLFKEDKKEEPEKKDDKAPAAAKTDSKLEAGTELVLRSLASEKEIRIPLVVSCAFDKDSRYLAYAVADPEGKANGLFRRTLGFTDLPEAAIHKAEKAVYKNLAWSKAETRLAFLSGVQDDTGRVASCSLWTWDGKSMKAAETVPAASAPSGMIIPAKNELTWTKDGKRLFFGLKPKAAEAPSSPSDSSRKEGETAAADLFDREKILLQREVDVWHWNDPLINSHQKKQWNRTKDRTFTAVHHLAPAKTVLLAGEDMPDISIDDNPKTVLGTSNVPYLKEITWDGSYQDVYAVSLLDGARAKLLTRHSGRPSLSPNGRFVAFYEDRDWHLLEIRTAKRINLTASLGVPFADEDHDTPDAPRGYGLAGWLEDESAVLVYDKFDIWQFSVPSGEPMNITAGFGRENRIIFRTLRLDPEERALAKGRALLLSSYNDDRKNHGFYEAKAGVSGVAKKLEEPKKFDFVAKAKGADVLLYTRESYDEFPDLWAAGPGFSSPRKLTDVNPQVRDFAWGSAELVSWTSADGVPLQGVLIKPGDYEPGKRYPVIIYFYELFSQRLHEFNQIVVNHRPCFPFYASHGYAVFLPDVRFKVGYPGPSSLKCIVPGAQKLIDMGIADPKRIGIHGHSWSGYETAYIVTQTDFFACAVAGAAVGNMTSAYSGIRWESGQARQFQYEKSQSRIGGSLWEKPGLYIENSPVFFADRVRTPLLLMHGDEDGAVPWYQSIEIYLAMRRLGKDCVFLQYRGEPHHPQKYANKLDYSIKMKEYFDHYLKGAPAAGWIAKGVLYSGK